MTTRPYVPRQPAPTTAAIPIMRFNPSADGLERWLGPLEAACMDYLYSADGPRTVKHVWHGMRSDNAYTTIMTTMTRLAKKGLLRRRRDGLAYVYDSTCTKEEFIELQIAAIVRSVEA